MTHPQLPVVKLWLGPLLCAAALCVWKVCLLSQFIAGSWWSSTAFDILVANTAPLGVLGLIISLSSVVRSRLCQILAIIICTFFLLSLVLHTIILIKIDALVTPTLLMRYIGDWEQWGSFISWRDLLSVVGFLLILSIRVEVNGFKRRLLAGVSVLCIFINLIALVNLSPFLGPYAFDPGMLTKSEIDVGVGYAEEFVESVVSDENLIRPPAVIPRGKPNIILLIVESLSSVDFFGANLPLGNLGVFPLPKLSAIAAEGSLYTNFFANSNNSEGGFIALFSATAGVPYPTAEGSPYDAFVGHTPILNRYREASYSTTFLTNVPSKFLGQGLYLSRTGFDVVLGRDEVPEWGEAERFSLGCPEDRLLYEKAVEVIKGRSSESNPFFLAVASCSSHTPWLSPATGEAEQGKVWEYVDSSISNFYQALREQGFFSNGVLLIIGDHRKTVPVSGKEHSLWGWGAASRVPLIAVGKDIPAAVSRDEIIDQAHLLPDLGLILRREYRGVKTLLFVDRRTVTAASPGFNLHAAFSVFDTSSLAKLRFPAHLDGTTLKWLQVEPPHAPEIERQIHQRRALDYYLSRSRLGRCDFQPTGSVPLHAETGLSGEVYDGTVMNGELNVHSERFLGSLNAPHLDLLRLPSKLDVPKNNFTLRLTGTLEITMPGEYDFRLESDDGSCLALNGRIVIDGGGMTFFGARESRMRLAAGRHSLELRYYQEEGYSGLRLLWRPPGQSSWTVVPAEVLHPSKTN
jgi:hypothetical protein